MRHLILHLFILTLFFLPWSLAQPDELSFWHLTTADGLSSDDVSFLFQDSRDFIWIGTRNGLNRYDGHSIQQYFGDPFDSLKMSGNWITRIIEDVEGYIWFFQNGPVHCFDPKTETFFDPNFVWIHAGIVREDLSELLGVKVEQIINGKEDPLFINTPGYSAFERKKDNTLWVKSPAGVRIYDSNTKPIDLPPTSVFHEKEFQNVQMIGEDSLNGVWIQSQDTLYRLNATTQTVTKSFEGRIKSKWVDSKGRVWLAFSEKGLLVYDPVTEITKRYESDLFRANGLSSDFISRIIEDKEGRIWIGTDKGVNVYDPYQINFTHYYHNPYNPNSLPGETIRSVMEDEKKGLWIGTAGDEIMYFDFESQKFKGFFPLKDGEKGQFGNWGYFYKDQTGKVYATSLGVQKATLIYDEKIDNFIPYHPEDLPIKLPYFTQTFPFEDSRGGRYYYSFPGGMRGRGEDYPVGLFYQPHESDSLFHFPSRANFSQAQTPNSDSLTGNYINDIIESSLDGSIWIATHQGGLNKFNPRSKKFSQYQYNLKIPSSINHNTPTDLLEDKFGNLWIAHGYGYGLNMIPAEALKADSIYFISYTTANSNLPSNSINDLYEDAHGYLWLGTNVGPLRYDYESDSFKLFKFSSKKIGNGPWGFSKGESGNLYVGSTEGLFIFHPDSLKSNPHPPEVYITDFSIFNQKVPIKGSKGDTLDWESPLEQSILFTKKLSLPYWQKDFTFEFVGINYTNPEQNHYEYKLENYDQEWRKTTPDKRLASYTNMSPGKYTFRVRAANNEGIWNEEGASITIIITPPFWATWWAYVIYSFLIFLFGYFLYRFLLNRQFELQETKRIKELDEVKTKLYTNISHEFRTPLTVISGMSDKIRENPRKWAMEGTGLIKRNSRHLLKLVNQILDLRKLESGTLKIQYVQADMVSYLQYLTQSFQSLAADKDIQLHFYSEEKELLMDFDPDKMQHIFSNILSNAIKYTPEGGDVYVRVEKGEVRGSRGEGGRSKMDRSKWEAATPVGGWGAEVAKSRTSHCLNIKVRDTGIGIPEDQLPHIFDRFYQVDDSSTRSSHGTGIGLALTRELVQLLEGYISVKSDPDAQSGTKGTEFTVRLPISNEAPLQEIDQDQIGQAVDGMVGAVAGAELLEQTSAVSDSKPLALIVEDNADVAKYLFSCMEENYQLLWAKNGQQGIDMAVETTPDIIISDVMMPQKDGFEVCQELKQNVRTSHIPIILLTAKADIDSKLEGLSHGADAYLAKPFNPEELHIRLQKLVELRRQLQNHYSQYADETKKAQNLEEEFLIQLRNTIQENLSKEVFGVQQLSRAMAMSRSQLFRKIKALTNKSTSSYIRTIRLNRAKELLKTTDHNISEIAYEVGFSNPVYFTQAFSEEFGVPPSEMRK